MRRSRSRTPVRRFEAQTSTEHSRQRKDQQPKQELRALVFKLAAKDTSNFFQEPVDVAADGAPDYYQVIRNPMDFTTLLRHVEDGKVHTLEQVRAAVELVCDNATLYNSNPKHPVHAAAIHLRHAGGSLIAAAVARRDRAAELARKAQRACADQTNAGADRARGVARSGVGARGGGATGGPSGRGPSGGRARGHGRGRDRSGGRHRGSATSEADMGVSSAPTKGRMPVLEPEQSVVRLPPLDTATHTAATRRLLVQLGVSEAERAHAGLWSADESCGVAHAAHAAALLDIFGASAGRGRAETARGASSCTCSSMRDAVPPTPNYRLTMHSTAQVGTDSDTDTASDSESDDDSYAWSPRHSSARSHVSLAAGQGCHRARSASPAARQRSSVARRLRKSHSGGMRDRARGAAPPGDSRSWLAIVGIMLALYLLSAAGAEKTVK